MRRAALVLCWWTCLAIAGVTPTSRAVSVLLEVEPGASVESFHWVLVELAPAVNGARTVHCRGRTIKEFARAEATRNAKGRYEWRGTLALDAHGASSKDSLALCYREDGRLRPLWSENLVSAKGYQLIDARCWVGDGLEVDCAGRQRPPAPAST